MHGSTLLPILALLAHGQQVATMPAPAVQLAPRGMSDSGQAIRKATIEAVKECTDRQGAGIALWVRGQGHDSLPLIKPEDAILEDDLRFQDPVDWSYRARIATIGAWSQFAAREIKDMFIHKDTPRNNQEQNCIYDDPEMSSVTVSIGTARNGTDRTDVDKYPPVTYTDLPKDLAKVKLTAKWPVYWAHLLSKTLADKWQPISTPVAEMKVEDAEQYAIAYCSILTGQECVATGTTEPRITKVDGVEVKLADEKVQRVLKRAGSMTPVIAIEPAQGDLQGVWAVEHMEFDFTGKLSLRSGLIDIMEAKATDTLRVVHIKGAESDSDEDEGWKIAPDH